MNFSIVLFGTPEARAKGLQHMKPIPPATLFVFPEVAPGTFFHSRNVLEDFDLSFLTARGEVIDTWTMEPPRAVVQAPEHASLAVEAGSGVLCRLGFDVGRTINLSALLGRKG